MRLKVTRKSILYFAIVVAFIAIAGVGWKLTARTSYESAEYSVVESDGPIELREYPDLMLVTTPMKSQGSDGSFGRLFRYISGENDNKRQVAMTTPVFMEPAGQDRDGQMGFVVPAKVSEGRIPDPVDENVGIQKRNGGRFAVIRFSGRMDPDSIAENERKLRTWIDSKGLSGIDVVEFAGYDPPWTPNPFRRNEILIRLQ
ncbi:MAG: heme-binding protein [Fuerstia sp.]|nr:heme-binding protein [Fuerstiella sp.]